MLKIGTKNKIKPNPKIYQSSDYKGEFNLLRMERSLIIKALNLTQSKAKAIKLLKISGNGLLYKLKSHQIKDSEWEKN